MEADSPRGATNTNNQHRIKNKGMNAKRILTGISALTMLMCVPFSARAQYFDDDIYYNASKDKKATTVKKVQPKRVSNYVPTPDYPAADTYSVPEYTLTPSKTRDVDEYNRRGMFANDNDTVGAISVNAD